MSDRDKKKKKRFPTKDKDPEKSRISQLVDRSEPPKTAGMTTAKSEKPAKVEKSTNSKDTDDRKNRRWYKLDEAQNTVSFNRQSWDELRGSDLMSKWRNSDVYKGTNEIMNLNRSHGISPSAIARARGSSRVLVSDIKEAERLRSEARSMDYKLRQQAAKARSDSFYELWKQKYQRKANNKTTPPGSGEKTTEQLVKEETDAAKETLQKQGVAHINKPLMNGTPAEDIVGSTEYVKKNTEHTQEPRSPGLDLMVRPFEIMNELGVPPKEPPKEPSSDSFLMNWGSLMAPSGGYNSLGSDGRYHKFSFQSDYNGGTSDMKAARRAALTTKYLDKSGNVTSKRQAEIDREISKGGSRIFVNGVELVRNQGSSGNVYSSVHKTGAGGSPRTRSISGRRTAPGTYEFNSSTEAANKAQAAMEGTAAQWQERWKGLSRMANEVGGKLKGSLTSDVYVADRYTGERISPEARRAQYNSLQEARHRAERNALMEARRIATSDPRFSGTAYGHQLSGENQLSREAQLSRENQFSRGGQLPRLKPAPVITPWESPHSTRNSIPMPVVTPRRVNVFDGRGETGIPESYLEGLWSKLGRAWQGRRTKYSEARKKYRWAEVRP